MSSILVGLVSGVLFGLFAVVTMIPMRFTDKTQALTAAFVSRFSIGFIVPNLEMPMSLWVSGAIVGLLISLSDAIITKAYVPILVMGTLGGGLIGLIAERLI